MGGGIMQVVRQLDRGDNDQSARSVRLVPAVGYDPLPMAPVTSVATDDRFVALGLANGSVRLLSTQRAPSASSVPSSSRSSSNSSPGAPTESPPGGSSASAESAAGSFAVQVERTVALGHGAKPVVRLEAAPASSLLFSLCDGHVDVLNSVTLDRLCALASPSAVQALCTDKAAPSAVRLATAIKGKLRIHQWVHPTTAAAAAGPATASARLELVNEYGLPATGGPISAMEWLGPRIVLVDREAYVLFSLRSGAVEARVRYGSGLAAVRVVRSRLLLLIDGAAATVHSDGTVVTTNVRFSPSVLFVCGCFPYLLGCGGDTVEVHLLAADAVQSLMQVYNVRDGILAAAEMTGGKVVVVTLQSLYFATPYSTQTQIKSLLKQGRLDEANVLYKLSSKDSGGARAREFALESGRALLKKGSVREAFIEFSKAETDPKMLMAYFPDLLPASVAYAGARKNIFKVFAREAVTLNPDDPAAAQQRLERSFRLQLTEYLEDFRRAHPNRDSSTAVAVDSGLVKLHAMNGADYVAKFLAGRAQFDREDVLAFLRKRGMHSARCYVLRHSGDFPAALKLCEGKLAADPSTTAVALDIATLLLSEAEADDLVFAHAPWLGERAPDRLLEVFAGPEARHRALPPEKVLACLQRFESRASVRLIESYLRALISWGAADPQYHTQLALIFLDQVNLDGRAAPSLLKGKTSAEATADLRQHLTSSNKYDARLLYERLRALPLRREFAYVVGRLGRHDEALAILVVELGDAAEAEAYCVAMDDAAAFTAYVSLQLQRQGVGGGAESLPPELVRFMTRHAQRLAVGDVLPLLPGTLRVAALGDYLCEAIRDSGMRARELVVQRQLLKGLMLQRHAERAALQASSVTIDDRTMCSVCRLPIARSVFAVYPNGVLVHFKCMNPDRSVCPVTQESFRGRGRRAK